MRLRFSCRSRFLKLGGGALALGFGLLGSAASPAQSAVPAGVTISTMAEVEIKPDGAAHRTTGLTTADHVVAGDQLVYTVEIHNSTPRALAGVVVINPIPERMGYVAASAQGPGADIDFSVDGGLNFAKPERLTIKLAGGLSRPATATAVDYTHIRWKLKYPLSANSIAFARFRASLK